MVKCALGTPFRIAHFCAWSLRPVQLCNPTDCSPPGSSVHRTSQARILERFTISSSRGSSWPRDRTASLAAPPLEENPTDQGAWQATVQGFTKSQTWLSNWACYKNTLSSQSILCSPGPRGTTWIRAPGVGWNHTKVNKPCRWFQHGLKAWGPLLYNTSKCLLFFSSDFID